MEHRDCRVTNPRTSISVPAITQNEPCKLIFDCPRNAQLPSGTKNLLLPSRTADGPHWAGLSNALKATTQNLSACSRPLRLGRANYQLRNRRKFERCKHQFHLAKWPRPFGVALQAENSMSSNRRTSFVRAPRGSFGSTIGHYGSDLRAERATLPANKSSEPATPMPSRNFAATRRVLVIVLISSILVPLLCIAGYGYFDYQRRVADAVNIVDRLTRVAQEHALKIVDLNNEIGFVSKNCGSTEARVVFQVHDKARFLSP
ncbi:hypothetical protein SAMN05446927_8147 [Caballeronia arationis]|uniref:Uncharacterized protein n=1 Tax=Caballeronia arationis TaxID=1777142 RepID=A0A7Z7IG21_9BURK|nr:hypothetical protein SAMN05446927_8147 [Caballeronia arationis]